VVIRIKVDFVPDDEKRQNYKLSIIFVKLGRFNLQNISGVCMKWSSLRTRVCASLESQTGAEKNVQVECVG
jgi:hypothetical protein